MLLRSAIVILIGLMFVIAAAGQRRDYLTAPEADVVRNAQEIDVRIAVLTYAIDRRFAALGIDAKGPKKPSVSTEDDWGPEPKGTKMELLTDIRFLLEKAIDDIDNLAGHLPEKTKEERKGENLFNKAVKSLNNSAKRWLPFLKREFATAPDESVHTITATSIDFCEQIIEAAAKLK